MNKSRNIVKRIYFFWLDWKLSAKVISSILCVTVLSISTLMIATYVNNVAQITEKTGNQLAFSRRPGHPARYGPGQRRGQSVGNAGQNALAGCDCRNNESE